MNLTIPNECRDLMAMQVTQYPADPDSPGRLAEAEHHLYESWLPGFPPTVLDLGCGLGRATAALHHHYLASAVYYHLVDGNLINEGPFTGGWLPQQQEWCCDLWLTRKFLKANGLKDDQIFTHDLTAPRDCFEDIPCVDLVISTLAVGFHWPIEPWLPRLEGVIGEGTRLIFGVRHGRYGPDTRFDGFETLGFAESGWRQDFLVLECISSIHPSDT